MNFPFQNHLSVYFSKHIIICCPTSTKCFSANLKNPICLADFNQQINQVTHKSVADLSQSELEIKKMQPLRNRFPEAVLGKFFFISRAGREG